MYDEKLSKNVITHLKVAPLIMLTFGYWMFSSNQLLSNDHLTPKPSSRDVEVTGHTFGTVTSREGWAAPAYPFLVISILFFILIVFGQFLNSSFNTILKKNDRLR